MSSHIHNSHHVPHNSHDHHSYHGEHGGHNAHDHAQELSKKVWPQLRVLYSLEWGDVVIIFVYSIFVALLSLATPVAVEAMVSTVMFGVVVWPIIWLALMLLLCLTVASVIHATEAYVIEVLQRRLFVRTAMDFADRLPRVKMEAYEKHFGPETVNRFFDIIQVQKACSTLLMDGVSIILTTAVGLVVLAFYHPYLLAFGIGLILCMGVLILLGRGAIAKSLAESHSKYEVLNWLQELARSPRSFKTGSGTSLAIHRAEELAKEYVNNRASHFNVVFRQFVFGLFLFVVANVLLLSLGGYLVMARQLTQGQLIAAELIVGLVIGSFLKLNKYLDAWYDLCTAVVKLSMVTDLPLERKGGASFSCNEGIEVRVKELSYEGQHRILDQLSWTVEAGQKVALSGRSGTGKSVLLDVIAGLREPTTGIIELDGIDLRDLELESIRREVAHVGGVEIFAGTIMENLRVGRDGIGLHQIREALTTVGLERTIQNLPNGLQTTLIPTGSPLSFSQSLRLCIARAILGNPRLLILDGVLDLIDLSDSKLLLDVLFSKDAPWTLIVATRSARVIERCDKVIGLEPQASLN